MSLRTQCTLLASGDPIRGGLEYAVHEVNHWLAGVGHTESREQVAVFCPDDMFFGWVAVGQNDVELQSTFALEIL